MMEHVRDDLSAYLDGALPPARRSAVDAHLATCPPCRMSLAELRAAARLIAALPAATPSRRLVPALAPRTSWLRPLRSLSAIATGAFLLVFMASATLDTGFRMGGGGSGATSGRLIGGPTPAAAALEAGPRTDTVSGGLAGAAGSPGPRGLADAAAQRSAAPWTEAPKAVGPPASEQAVRRAQDAAAARPPQAAPEPLRVGPSPWLWLGLGALSALLAFVAHRRLRAP